MIPKIIHYCWFGGNPLPELAQKCIASWKKYFPDYEIKEWNESNYDVHKIPYTSESYNAKKYAFVSDYARFDILYQYGGVYFDTDVEVIKPLGDILNDTGFMGTEELFARMWSNDSLEVGCNAGLGIGVAAGLGICLEILESYTNEHFFCNDGVHEYNLKTIVTRVTEILVKYGFDVKSNEIQKVADITIYPPEYFCPINNITGKIMITNNTYTVHHFTCNPYTLHHFNFKSWDELKNSWGTKKVLQRKMMRYSIYKMFGVNIFSNLLIVIMGIINRFLKDGFIHTIRYYFKRYLADK